jgi:hypothetical protein
MDGKGRAIDNILRKIMEDSHAECNIYKHILTEIQPLQRTKDYFEFYNTRDFISH